MTALLMTALYQSTQMIGRSVWQDATYQKPEARRPGNLPQGRLSGPVLGHDRRFHSYFVPQCIEKLRLYKHKHIVIQSVCI